MYSPEDGTPAARMPDQIPEEVKQDRLDRLMRLQQGISRKRNQARVGQTETVLVTGIADAAHAVGRSSREAPEIDGEIRIHFDGAPPRIGEFITVRLTNADIYDLKGERI